MLKYAFKRLLMIIPVVIGVTFIVFTLMYLTPGDAAVSMLNQGGGGTQEDLEMLREEMGLNDPFLVQYGRYMKKLVFEGDLGTSYVTNQSVSTEIFSRFPTTVTLAFISVVFAAVIGIPLGIISATRQYSILDNICITFALVGVSMPNFWLGLLLIIVFALNLKWLPVSGWYGPIYWIMPMLTIGLRSIAVITRMTRSSMLEVIRQDYIRTARAKGQSERKIIYKHALRNAIIPVITTIGLQFGHNLGGAVIIESIFAIPGVGKLMVDGINLRNYPVVQGGVLIIALAFCIVNLLVDLLYALVDPRIRANFSAGGKRRSRKAADR